MYLHVCVHSPPLSLPLSSSFSPSLLIYPACHQQEGAPTWTWSWSRFIPVKGRFSFYCCVAGSGPGLLAVIAVEPSGGGVVVLVFCLWGAGFQLGRDHRFEQLASDVQVPKLFPSLDCLCTINPCVPRFLPVWLLLSLHLKHPSYLHLPKPCTYLPHWCLFFHLPYFCLGVFGFEKKLLIVWLSW